MLEALVAGGGDAAAAARGRAAQRAGLSARRQRREIPPAGGARRSASARDHARRRRALAGAGAGVGAIVGDQVVAEAELLLGLVPDRTDIDPSAIGRSRARRSARGRRSPPHAIDRSAREDRRQLPDRRLGRSSTAGPRSATTCEIYPFALDRPGAAGPEVPRRRDAARRSGNRNIFREFVTIHRGTRGGGGVTTIGDRNVLHGLRARGARLPCRRRHDLRQHGDARRPRHRRGLTRTSAPDRACTSSAASDGTRSSAATRW